jgi:hypothetical protein
VYIFVGVALVGSLIWLWIALAYTAAPVQALLQRRRDAHARELDCGRREVDLQGMGVWAHEHQLHALATGLVLAAIAGLVLAFP